MTNKSYFNRTKGRSPSPEKHTHTIIPPTKLYICPGNH